MGHSQAEKALSRERILAEAARQVRDGGLESVSVGGLMKSVGLTHGGFYGHFENREALLAEALARALRDSGAKLGGGPKPEGGTPAAFPDIVRGYLSRQHRDARDSGCAIAALASDVARADTGSRDLMSGHVEGFIDTVAASLGGDRQRAALAVSAMVGALALSRVAADPAQSDAILRTVREALETLGPAEAS